MTKRTAGKHPIARPNGQVTSLVGTFTNGVVELTWTENATNETRYEIERYEIGAGGTVFIVVGTVATDPTSFIDTTALKGTSYDYRVRAVTTTSNSPFTNAVTATARP